MNAPVRPGEVLAGKYRVERVLGEGGMGVVVAARHLQLDQIVALKFLRTASVVRQDTLDRFAREARNAVRLRSEHVARIMDVGTLDSGAPYIVMEYLEGSDLASVLAQRGKLPIPVAVDYVLQACDAIAEAHALGIIHRDLKPENLFVTRGHDNTSLVKVLDFGISKSTASGEFSATSSQAVIGSPAYMSPEQMRSARLVDVRTDVWALGVILYQLVVGHVPWDGDTLPVLCCQVTTDPPPPFPDRHQADFETVVWRCLEKDPARRFSSVHALAVALAPFAPPHAAPLVERIGRVLKGRADGPLASLAADGDALETLREMSGERMRRTALAPRTRKLIGVIATVGALAAAGIAAVVLGVGRDGAATEPAPQPAAKHPVTPPVAASAPDPVVAPPPPVAAPAPDPVVASPSPPAQPEPASAPPAAEAPPPVPGEPPRPSPAIRPRGKEHRRTPGRPSTATVTRPVPAAPSTAAPPPSDPSPPVKPPAAPDPLASPD